MAEDMLISIVNLALSSLTGGVQIASGIEHWKSKREAKKYDWVDKDAAMRAATASFFQLALTRICFNVMHKLLRDNNISAIYPLHPGERGKSRIPKDDITRFYDYYKDWSHHLKILEREQSIVLHYNPSPSDPSSRIDQDLVLGLKKLETALNQLQHNQHIDIQGVAKLVEDMFTETEARIGQRLGLDDRLARPPRADVERSRSARRGAPVEATPGRGKRGDREGSDRSSRTRSIDRG